MKTLQELKSAYDKAIEQENNLRKSINALRRKLTIACRKRSQACQEWWMANRENKS